MQILPIDVVALVATVMGTMIVLIPVAGLTMRFALKPTVEALGRFFEKRGADETLGILERRVALLEHQLEAMEGSVRRLEEVTEFHDRLQAPAPGGEDRS